MTASALRAGVAPATEAPAAAGAAGAAGRRVTASALRAGVAPATEAVEVAVLRSRAAFAALAAEWDALAAPHGHALLRHDWLLSCAETLHEERDLRVVTIRRAGRLVAAAPLAIAGRRWIRRLELLGMWALHEPSGLLYDSEASLAQLTRAVVALKRAVVLQRLEAGGPVPAAFRRVVGRPGAVIVRPTAPAFGIPTRGPWTEYERGLSSHIRTNLRRQRTRAARLGPVATVVLAPGTAEAGAAMDTVIAVEGSGWKGRSGSALRCRPELEAFFRAYARRAAEAGRLRVALLHVGDRVAAVELAVEDFGRWWQLKIGYLDELRPFYPGLQLTYDTVRRAFEQDLAGFEFLGSVADWESRWNPTPRPFEVCLAYPPTLAGGAALLDDVGGVAVHRLTAAVSRKQATA